MENEISDNEEQIELLDSMAVFHHEVVDDDEYMQSYYATVDQLTNKGGLSLVAKPFIPFGRNLMKNVRDFQYNQSFQHHGNSAVSSAIERLLESTILKKIFWDCLGHPGGYLIDDGTQRSRLSVFVSICKKTMHAWAGKMSRKFKEMYTGRHATKNLSNFALRVALDAQTQQSKKRLPKKEEEDGVAALGVIVDAEGADNTIVEEPTTMRKRPRQKKKKEIVECGVDDGALVEAEVMKKETSKTKPSVKRPSKRKKPNAAENEKQAQTDKNKN